MYTTVVCMLGIDPQDKCRQYNRKTVGSYVKKSTYTSIEKENALFESMGTMFMPVPCTIDTKSPVTSIDQLYAQVPIHVSCVCLCVCLSL